MIERPFKALELWPPACYLLVMLSLSSLFLLLDVPFFLFGGGRPGVGRPVGAISSKKSRKRKQVEKDTEGAWLGSSKKLLGLGPEGMRRFLEDPSL